MCDLHLVGLTADLETEELINRLCNSGCHVSTVKLSVKSLEALQAACLRLGLEFIEGQTTYVWYRRYMGDSPLPDGVSVNDLGKCTHAIKVPGARYEVGVVAEADGTYSLRADYWASGGLVQILGNDLNKLRQAYGIETAKLAAMREGYSVWEEVLEDGAVKLHVQVPA